MGFDFAKRRAEIMAAMDLNVIKQGELASEMRDLQRDFRQLELREREARDKMPTSEPSAPLYVIRPRSQKPVSAVPTGVQK